MTNKSQPTQLLYASGFLFMGATEEQMRFLSEADVTHVSYILILYSIAFLLYLFVNILLYIYAAHTWPDDESNGVSSRGSSSSSSSHHGRNMSIALPGPSDTAGIGMRKSTRLGSTVGNGHIALPTGTNGSVRLPRHRATDSQQVRDAEEFELEGLISEGEEDDESPKIAKKEVV